MDTDQPHYTAFLRKKRIAEGDAAQIAQALAKRDLADTGPGPLIFDDATGRTVDAEMFLRSDLVAPPRSTEPDNAPAETAPAPPKRGRPRLGVVAREVTLLPRHWEWLSRQPGGASVALRKIVDAERRRDRVGESRRLARDAAFRFAQTMAGDEPGFEEATRALFAGDRTGFHDHTRAWPAEIRDHALQLADASFAD